MSTDGSYFLDSALEFGGFVVWRSHIELGVSDVFVSFAGQRNIEGQMVAKPRKKKNKMKETLLKGTWGQVL